MSEMITITDNLTKQEFTEVKYIRKHWNDEESKTFFTCIITVFFFMSRASFKMLMLGENDKNVLFSRGYFRAGGEISIKVSSHDDNRGHLHSQITPCQQPNLF